MKITKFVHSCLLVEMPAPVNHTALFDPGNYSEGALDIDALEYLDDIIITHEHQDHFHLPLIERLVAKFPSVHITAPDEVVQKLRLEGLQASSEPGEGIELFESPHEVIRPYFDTDPPQEIGVHYLSRFSHPGDSHSFKESKEILALPVQAPWGSTVNAVKLALDLQPKYIIPIHDWHWSDEARRSVYGRLENLFAEHGITFYKPETGQPIVLDV